MGHYPGLRSSRRSAGTLHEANMLLVDIEQWIVRRATIDYLLVACSPGRTVWPNSNEVLYGWHSTPVGVEGVCEAVVESDCIDRQLIDGVDVDVHVEMAMQHYSDLTEALQTNP